MPASDAQTFPNPVPQSNFNYPQIGFHNHLFNRPMYIPSLPPYPFQNQNGFGIPNLPLNTPDQMFVPQIGSNKLPQVYLL